MASDPWSSVKIFQTLPRPYATERSTNPTELYTRNCLHGIDHAPLHRGHSVAACSPPCQVQYSPALRSAARNRNCCAANAASPRTATIDEVTSTAQIAICTTSNMSRTVIRRPASPIDPSLHHLVRIRAQHLSHRHRAEQKPAHQRQQQCDPIDIRVRIHRHIDGKLGKRLPRAQPAQQHYAARQPDRSAGERNQKRLR